MVVTALQSMALVTFGLHAALFWDEVAFSPPSWAVLSVCCWSGFVLAKGGWSALTANDARRFGFGVLAAVAFLQFLQWDGEFEGWSSVYYFCGSRLQYCGCGFRWNGAGWAKACVLWAFVLSAVLGAQQLLITAGLGGLLPGEEAVTRESFVSICWRLIPYWLNNWEQQWGAEVSSMTFELPHFAVELLIILPCCQIICSRLKVLVTPQVNVLLLGPHPHPNPHPQQQGQGQGQQQGVGQQQQQQQPGAVAGAGGEAGAGQRGQEEPAAGGAGGGGGGAEEVQFAREDFAPNVLQGFWERSPEQRHFLPRVRRNLRVLAFLSGLTALAAFNATAVPLYLERQATAAAATPAVMLIGSRASTWLVAPPGTVAATNASAAELALLPAVHARLNAYFGPRHMPGQQQGQANPALAAARLHAAAAAASLPPRQRQPQDPGQQPQTGQQQPQPGTQQPHLLPRLWAARLELLAAVLGIPPGTLRAVVGGGGAGGGGGGGGGTVQSSDPGGSGSGSGSGSGGGGNSGGEALWQAVAALHALLWGRDGPGGSSYASYPGGGAGGASSSGGGGGGGKGCPSLEPYVRNVAKHAAELARMKDPEHRSLIPLVEAALAIMRLSCEKYWVLLAIYLAFLIFRDAPRPARLLIRLIARVSSAFQRVILFAFPAVCWLYNAGLVFSLFVSVVFWGGPALAAYEAARACLRECILYRFPNVVEHIVICDI
ncbi:hypothetical protein CHLRE_08g383800v5 [Chlamydomonas reinhardtii]|uniref:Uncharacterized protein n=1 Tax=Chlamydomonas reinhardtii TaxID=3055 RepID=A0A2K3DI92_CHLRE|nr:uncharacterized protein CHLRE_08g383800v5 [Chlamydomonas reinhardtii]PNW80246.1 hypothetical protein CHLRE_08g383800v5 [Chlamydomonas reinhardtii]